VVLVPLDDEVGPAAGGARAAEVAEHPPDEEAGFEARAGEDPRDQRRAGRLAVRAGDDDVRPAGEVHLLQGGGEREVAQAAADRLLHLWVVGPHGVADDHELGVRGDVRGTEADLHLDAQAGEEVRHRRVRAGVRAADPVPALPEELRERAHPHPADGAEVYIHPDKSLSLRPRLIPPGTAP